MVTLQCMTLLFGWRSRFPRYPQLMAKVTSDQLMESRGCMRYTEIRMERIAHELLADQTKIP